MLPASQVPRLPVGIYWGAVPECAAPPVAAPSGPPAPDPDPVSVIELYCLRDLLYRCAMRDTHPRGVGVWGHHDK
jgi:hypothetical protein